jgi:membrane associated rhomboid family serine protease
MVFERIALHRPGDEIVLSDSGLQLESPSRWRRGPLIGYSDITHFAASSSGFWLGTRSDIIAIHRSRFRDPEGPETLARALTLGIARQTQGLEQLTRIAQIGTLARRPLRRPACKLLALLCVVAYLIQLQDPFVEEIGALVPSMVDTGQLWRLVTANLLHGVSVIPMHLLFNLLGLLALALLVERPLGGFRTSIVMAVSGLFSMTASYLAGVGNVIGASGIVMGLAGSALCLEFHYNDRLPVGWRVPRRAFVTLLLIDGILGFAIPFVAGHAHLGGFAGGYLATLFVGQRGVMRLSPEPWLRNVAMGLGVIVVVSLAFVPPLLMRNSGAIERYAQQLLANPRSWVASDNELAWRMTTETDATVKQLEVAEELANRAAARTDYSDPDILDTLAEVLSVRGDLEGALRTIDEAIRISRGERYFIEQRRRFTGEREWLDRPAPPSMPWIVRNRLNKFDTRESGIVI